ncbi:hypothetical protein [Halobacillus sp. Nhm2S1]|uniref:hypothetical protein n=1 Tax=Halobacillus sp. Nhm2S1 TaxID=2866716 RepID=UPI001C73172C|nr:hypothetical protein [Halobacillus sp. Nhm2S1]MBX0358362.1 hypothetical protein [Halobacillus sp. Nhm2S1]
MNSIFSFMKDVAPEFVEIGEKVEALLYEQPNSALVQARLYGEHLGKLVAKQEGTEQVYETKHVDRLHKLLRKEAIEVDIFKKFDWLRKSGNKAAHEPNFGDVEHAIRAHRHMYDLSVWYVQLYVSFDYQTPIYELPKPKKDASLDKEELTNVLQPLLNESLESVVGKQWQEMKKEIEELKKIKDHVPAPQEPNEGKMDSEPKLEKQENGESNVPYALFQYLEEEHGLEVLDKRPNNGAIWVIGGWELKDVLFQLKKYNVYFRFAKRGSKSTNKKPAWFMLNKWPENKEEERERLKKQPDTNQEPQSPKATSDTDEKVIEQPETEVTPEQEKDKAEQEEKTVEKVLSVEFFCKNNMTFEENGQLYYPENIKAVDLATFENTPLEQLKTQKEVQRVSDLSDQLLRDIYMNDREWFYQLVHQLYLIGVRFTGRLNQFQPVNEIDEEYWLNLSHLKDRPLKAWLPQTYAQRLEEAGVITMHQLNGLSLSSLQWLFKDLYKDLLTFLQTYEETEVKKGDFSGEKVVTNKLNFSKETIQLSEKTANLELNHENFLGVNNLLSQMQSQGLEQVGDLPSSMDGLHLNYKHVGPGAIKKLWQQIVEKEDQTPVKEDSISYEKQGEVIIFDKESIDIPGVLRDVPIDKSKFSAVNPIINQLSDNGVNTYGDLPVDFLSIVQWKGAGRGKVKKFFQQLAQVFKELENELQQQALLSQMDEEERLQYFFQQSERLLEDLFHSDTLQKEYKIQPRYIELMKKKHESFQLGEHLTLERMGSEVGVTRERIRQVLQKNNERLLQLLNDWLSRFKEKFKSEPIINNQWFYLERLSHYVMTEILELEDITLRMDELYLTLYKSEPFLKIVDNVVKEFKQSFYAKLFSKEDLKQWSEKQADVQTLPIGFVEDCIKEEIQWVNQGSALLRSIGKKEIVQLVMREYPEGVEIFKKEEELIQKANQYLQNSFRGERSFTSIVGREDLMDTHLLWGRGTYIHRDHVNEDIAWLKEVQNQSLQWLEHTNTINIQKIYQSVKEVAHEKGIPNEYALYSLLRKHPIEELSYQKFPKVSLQGVDIGQNKDWIRKLLTEHKDPVPYGELREEFVHKRGWKEFTLQYNLSSDDEVIQYKHGFYTLLSYYDHITKETYQPVIDRVEELLEDQPIIQIGRIFEELQTFLAGYGVHSSYLLYHTLKRVYKDVRYPRHPYITKEDINKDELSMVSLVEEYVKSWESEVPREELHDWITSELGGHGRLLDNVLQRSENIFYYTSGRSGEYIHRDVIGWNEEKKEELHRYCLQRVKDLMEVREMLVFTIDDLFSPTDLPILKDDMIWTEDLLIDCLKKDERWSLLGSYNCLVVSDDLSLPYATNVQFITYILDARFDKAAKLSDFNKELRNLSYSQDGDILQEVEEAMTRGETDFLIEGDEILMKSLKEFTYES